MSSDLDSTHVPVLIVGGGVVGLSAALFLNHHGIRTTLIEKHSGTSIHPRARSVNARTMVREKPPKKNTLPTTHRLNQHQRIEC